MTINQLRKMISTLEHSVHNGGTFQLTEEVQALESLKRALSFGEAHIERYSVTQKKAS